MLIPGLHLQASQLLHLAALSYDRHTCRVNGVECLVTDLAGYQVVSFRGTEARKLITGGGWIDVLRDLRTIPWYDKRVGWSHAGFLKGAQGVVDKSLFGLLKRDRPIIFTGHSLGGALSINAAAILQSEGFKVSAVVTFGAPRTLTKGASKRFSSSGINIWEFSNKGDPVPDVPFRWWGYRHVREVHTKREANGYSIRNNHLINSYKEAFNRV